MTTLRPVAAERLPRGPDPLGWITLDRLTRRVIGWRMQHGPTSETDEALDNVMLLRTWTARRLVN
jgi:hypothetical protein